jgi:long-chain acyl-CoA synthetase
MFFRDKIELNNIAVVTDKGDELRYSELVNISNIIFNKIAHRSLVFCLCSNSLGSLFGYLAFISNRIVPLLLDSSINKEILDELINIYQPKYLWLPANRISEYPTGHEIYSTFDYSLIKLNPENTFFLHDDLALLLTTSGSTGSPKFVRISYENLEDNASSIADYLSIDIHERPVTTLPMNYSFGLSILNSHLLKGAKILLTSKSIMEKEFWTFLIDKKATSLSGVPFTFEILKKIGFLKMDLPFLKTLTQAGGKLNIELNKEFAEYCHKKDKQFFVMYGQTEATARMSYLPSEYSLSKLGSIGIAIPGGEFSLIDESKSAVEGYNTIGELVYKGKNVSMGYAECGLDLQKGDENKGILFTGDLAKRDCDNFYSIVGRKKRFIKLFGNRIDLDETERILKSILPECACVGEDDLMKIFITDSKLIEKSRNFISAKTGIHPSAFMIKIIDSIPRTTSGKTIYSDLV